MKENKHFETRKVLTAEFEYLKKTYVEELFKTGAVVVRGQDEEPFKLRSGGESYIYVDHAKVGTSRNGFVAMISSIHYVVSQEVGVIDSVMNVDSKLSAQLTGAYSALFGIDMIVFKGEGLLVAERGTKKQLTGGGESVVILDDVGTSGRTIVEASSILKDSAKVKNIFAVVGLVREPKIFRKNLLKENIESFFVVTLDDVLQQNFNRFNSSQKQSILKEREIS